VRGILHVKRVGHGGTLDPLASGLLPVLVGAATKFAERFHEAIKVYDARVRFGGETTTDDREGPVSRTADVPPFDRAAMETALDSLRGAILQVPPSFAALKVAGRPAYARARAGEQVVLAARRVQVHRLEVIATDPPDVRLLVVCSSGTYVRAIARDLGRALGSAAFLEGLRRLAVGALDVSNAIPASEMRARGAVALTESLRPTSDDLLAVDPRFLERPATIVVAGDAHR